MEKGNKEIKERAIKEMEKYHFLERISEYGKPLFLMVSGAHNFGFPSPDSDLDIRGVYQAPVENFLGLRKTIKEPSFEYMGKDKMLDISVDEIGHYLNIVADSNGNRIEWPNSKLIFYESKEFGGLREIVNDSLSKDLLNHYLHFARDMWAGKTKEEGVKKDLYALRVYMSGISIFEDKKIIPDITELNKKFKEDIVGEMIREKQKGEWVKATGYDKKRLASLIEKLDSRLIDAVKNSDLLEKVDVEKINIYLRNLRLKEFN